MIVYLKRKRFFFFNALINNFSVMSDRATASWRLPVLLPPKSTGNTQEVVAPSQLFTGTLTKKKKKKKEETK